MVKMRRAIDTCACCEEPIYEGEWFFDVSNKRMVLCEDCLNELSAMELLEYMDEQMKEATRDAV